MRERLTYSNVVSTLCLFIVLGGTSYAVATGSIDSREVKNNAIRSRDVRNNDIRSTDLRDRSLTGRDIALDSLGGNSVKESELGKVPTAGSADLLAGLPPTAFAAAPLAGTGDFVENDDRPLLTVPGYGILAVSGCDPSAGEVDLEFRSAVDLNYWRTTLGLLTPTDHETVAANTAANDFTLSAGPQTGTIHLARTTPPGQAVIEFAFVATGGGEICRVAAMATTSG